MQRETWSAPAFVDTLLFPRFRKVRFLESGDLDDDLGGRYGAEGRRVRKLSRGHLQGNPADPQQAQLATRCGRANTSRVG